MAGTTPGALAWLATQIESQGYTVLSEGAQTRGRAAYAVVNLVGSNSEYWTYGEDKISDSVEVVVTHRDTRQAGVQVEGQGAAAIGTLRRLLLTSRDLDYWVDHITDGDIATEHSLSTATWTLTVEHLE